MIYMQISTLTWTFEDISDKNLNTSARTEHTFMPCVHCQGTWFIEDRENDIALPKELLVHCADEKNR
jgi:hypothetical protein